MKAKMKAKQLIEAVIAQGHELKQAKVIASELMFVVMDSSNIKFCNSVKAEILAYKQEQEDLEKYSETDRKLLLMVALFPVFADVIEDVELYRKCKKYGNMFIDEVRKVDTIVMKTDDIKAQAQQVDIQTSFKQWLKQNFYL